MRSIEVKLYKFDELTDAAKEKARDWFREFEAQDFGGHGELFADAETAALLLGVTFNTQQVDLVSGKTRTESDIRYSGFSSQGDGASFTGSYRYAQKTARRIREEFPTDTTLHGIADALQALQAQHGYKLRATITQDGQYVHKMTMHAEIYQGDDDTDTETSDALLEILRDFAEWIYRNLEAQYDDRMSDESVDDNIRGNEYEFLESGKRA